MYVYGYRQYNPVTTQYDQNGLRRSIVDPFRLKLNGQGIIDGKGGSDLQRLGREISKYDSRGQQGGVIDRLKLGEVRAEGKATVKAQYLALGYGWSPKLTFFGILPYVDARTDVQLAWAGENNALLIKQELGELAFDELKQALDRASRISLQDIEQAMADKGYKPVRTWSHQGVGDLQLGARTAYSYDMNRHVNYSLALTGAWGIPTGYADDPDVLTDFSFGDEVHTLLADADNQLQVGPAFIGVDPSIKIGIPGQVQRRVPVYDETLVDADRKASVVLMPGPTVGTTFYVGAGTKLLRATYRLGSSYHTRDQYSGSLSGNYKALADGSESQTNYHELGLRVSTIDAYMEKKFFMPAIINFTAHQDMKGKNSKELQYFELAIGSFLDIAAPKSKASTQTTRRSRGES